MTKETKQKESEKLEEQQEVTESKEEAQVTEEVTEKVDGSTEEVTEDATSKEDENTDDNNSTEEAESDDSDIDSDDDDEDDEESSKALTEPSVTKEEFSVLRKEVRDIGIRKEWLFEVRSIVSKEIKSLFAMLKELKESRDVLTSQVQELKDEREHVNVDIKGAISKIKAVQGPKDGPRINVGKLKKELEKLQFYLETNPLSPDEEKKVMKQVKEKEKLIAKAGPEPTAEKGDAKELSKKINDLKDKSNEIHDKVQANAVESQVKHEAMISVSKEIKFLKAREKEIHNLFVETKSEYKDKRRLLMQNRKFFSQPSAGANKKAPRKVSEKEAMKKVEENIQEKIKLGKKITTEDLLSFGK